MASAAQPVSQGKPRLLASKMVGSPVSKIFFAFSAQYTFGGGEVKYDL